MFLLLFFPLQYFILRHETSLPRLPSSPSSSSRRICGFTAVAIRSRKWNDRGCSLVCSRIPVASRRCANDRVNIEISQYRDTIKFLESGRAGAPRRLGYNATRGAVISGRRSVPDLNFFYKCHKGESTRTRLALRTDPFANRPARGWAARQLLHTRLLHHRRRAGFSHVHRPR